MKREYKEVPNMNSNLHVVDSCFEEDGSISIFYEPIIAFAYEVEEAEEPVCRRYYPAVPITPCSSFGHDSSVVIVDKSNFNWWVAESCAGETLESLKEYLGERYMRAKK